MRTWSVKTLSFVVIDRRIVDRIFGDFFLRLFFGYLMHLPVNVSDVYSARDGRLLGLFFLLFPLLVSFLFLSLLLFLFPGFLVFACIVSFSFGKSLGFQTACMKIFIENRHK